MLGYNNANKQERTHRDRPDLFLRRISTETARGLFPIGWQGNPCLFRIWPLVYPHADLGAIIDYNAQVSAVKKVLSAMARDAGAAQERLMVRGTKLFRTRQRF